MQNKKDSRISLVRVAFSRGDFLQNPYLVKISSIILVSSFSLKSESNHPFETSSFFRGKGSNLPTEGSKKLPSGGGVKVAEKLPTS